MLKAVILFAVGLVLLIVCGDWFVDGSTGIARRFHIPEIIVGATIVSIGTTLPEVMVSATGAMTGLSSMAYGNAIGSIICNSALIAAITVTCKPGPVDTKSMKMPVIFFFVSAAIYCVAAYIMGEFTRPIGLIMVAIFCAYMFVNIKQGIADPDSVESEEEEDGDEKPRTLLMDIVFLVAGAAGIAVGANLLVNNGTIIAQGLGVPETVIALTFVALGTSLPELVTAITSLMKGHGALSLGNVIGANVFNLVLVSGVSVTLAPFKVPVGKLLAGMNASLVLEIPVMLGVMVLLCVPPLLTKKLHRWQGIALLATYAAFCCYQFFL